MEDQTELVFTALADSTRRYVLELIASENGLSATELAAKLPITRQAVSKHLVILEAADLVTVRQDGRDKRYLLKPQPLEEAMSWIHRVGMLWDQRLERLRDLLEHDEEEN